MRGKDHKVFLRFSLGCLESESCSVVSDSLQPHGLYSPWNSPGQSTGVGSLSLLQGIFPTWGSNPGLPLWADSLPAEPSGKPRNTWVHSFSLLQGIFPTQGLNRGLLPCRQILYQLSPQGSPSWLSFPHEIPRPLLKWLPFTLSAEHQLCFSKTPVSGCCVHSYFLNWNISGACVITSSRCSWAKLDWLWERAYPKVLGGKTRMVVNTTLPAVFIHPCASGMPL